MLKIKVKLAYYKCKEEDNKSKSVEKKIISIIEKIISFSL